MKSRFLQFVGLCLLPLFVPMGAEEPASERSDEQLEQLFGPIALYPDALIAIILPASTVPSDVVLAARYLETKGDPENMDAQPWDDSVKSLVHYPEVIKWMDENLAWTKQAGETFLTQPAAVMNAIQRLRARAKAAGTLIDTPQQQVVVEDNNIQIVPTQPDVIYVPIYDPEIVYISNPGFYSDPFLTFGPGYMTGFWLGYSLDWGHRRIWTIDRRDSQRYWQDHRDWRRPPPGPVGVRQDAYRSRPWAPSPNYPRPPQRAGNRPRPEIAHPTPQRRPAAPNSAGVRPGGPQPNPRADSAQPPTNRRRENRPAPPANGDNSNRRPAPQPAAPSPTPQPQALRTPSTSPVPPQSQYVRRERPPERREARSERGETPGNPRNPQGRIQSSPATAGSPPLQRSAPPPAEVRSRPQPSPQASPPAPRAAPPPPPAQSDKDNRQPRG